MLKLGGDIVLHGGDSMGSGADDGRLMTGGDVEISAGHGKNAQRAHGGQVKLTG